jgi:hypothetical protein
LATIFSLLFSENIFFSLFSFLPLFSSGPKCLRLSSLCLFYTVQFHLRIMLELCSLFVVLALRSEPPKIKTNFLLGT